MLRLKAMASEPVDLVVSAGQRQPRGRGPLGRQISRQTIPFEVTGPSQVLSLSTARPVTLAIGPDGGWVPFEVDLLERAGFTPVSLGARVPRAEVAVSDALGSVR